MIIFTIIVIIYFVTSKCFLLEHAREDIKIEYKTSNNLMKLNILLILPLLFIKGY